MISFKILPHCCQRAELQHNSLPWNTAWGSWQENTACQAHTVQSGSRAKGGSLCSFYWPFGNCKERRHILPFHPSWTVWTQTKRQGTNSPASKKPCAQPSKTKTMLITFFDCKGVVHEEFFLQGQNKQRCTAPRTWEHSTSSPRVVGSREVALPKQQCMTTYSVTHQRIFVITSNHCVAACTTFSRFVTLRFFPFSHGWNKHWKAIAVLTFSHSDGRDKTVLQHSRKCFPGLLQRPPETLEVVYCCRRKLFWRRSFAQNVSVPYSFLYHLSWNFMDVSCISVQKTKLMAWKDEIQSEVRF